MSINRIVLVGRLTKDPELRYTPSGVAVARFTLAVNRTFSNDQGEKEADFINCTVWRKPAENTANFLKKGSLAGVEGRIQTGSYEGTDGKRVYTTEVVCDSVQFLEPRSDGQRSEQSNQRQNQQSSQQNQQQGSQQSQNSNQQQNNQQSQYGNQQHSYAGRNDDPFSGPGPIEVSDDDLPF